MTPATTPGRAPFNAADYLVDRHLREARGDSVAVMATKGALSYRDLAEQVHSVAGGLAALGLRPEERALFCMADDAELLTGMLAAMYLGAVAVPVSTMLGGPELAKLICDSRSRIVCGSTEFASTIISAVKVAAEVTDVVFDATVDVDAPFGVRMHQWATLAGGAPITSPYPTWEDSPAFWLYTSGTTGIPKAAMHRHGGIRAVAESYGTKVLGITPQDRCLSVAKLFFAYGLGNSCFFPLSVGAAAVLERARPTPAVIAKRVRGAAPTLLFGVPAFYASVLAGELPDDTFRSVRQGVSAGEALPARLLQRFGDRFGVELLDGIGSTEALHIFISNRPHQVRPGSSGVPVPGYEVELRDDTGTPIAGAGQPGTLHVRGASIASGYWCQEEATRQVFQGDWLCTGDVYLRNQDGTYTCLGRSGDMLKAGGIWVSPAEVEEQLLAHPDVAEAIVVSAFDDSGLEKPVACVVAQPGRVVDADGLIDWCRQGLAAFKRPRAVVALAELPKTATGKVRRNQLRELVADVLGGPPAQATASRLKIQGCSKSLST
jgi:benzoate-CoA ligase family protein